MIDYCVVEAVEFKSLAIIVRGMIKKGWQPQGGISICPGLRGDYPDYNCVQAMVKDPDLSISVSIDNNNLAGDE